MKRAFGIIAAFIMLALAAAAGAESVKVYVAVNTVRFYEGCSEDSGSAGSMGYGEAVTCINVKGGWAKVKNSSGNVAFCDVESLTAQDPNTYSTTAYVQTAGANAYRRPSDSADAHSVRGGTKVTVVAVTPDGSWCRVTCDGKYGYMRKSELSTSKITIQTRTVYVNTAAAKVYESASESSEELGSASFGEALECAEVENGWAHVSNGSADGWCKTDDLTKTDPNTLSVKIAPAVSSAKVYKKASTSSGVLAEINTDATLTCVAVTPDGKWARVSRSGKYGYVLKSDFVNGTSSKADALVSLAMEQMGKPYVYATRGPSTFDCSGFTLYCYKKIAGIDLSRSAQGQGYDSRFPKVASSSNLVKGDLVCFNTDGTDEDLTDHVGIYLGSKKFIHCSSAGEKVMISSMASGFYDRTYSWGLRLLK